MSQVTEVSGNVIELRDPGSAQPPVVATGSAAMILDKESIDQMLKFADIMALAKVTVPQHLAGKPGDCLAVVMQAMQWKMNPFAVAQKTHVVNGTLGYEAQLVNAVVQSSGAITGHFSYEYQGDNAGLSCRVGAIIRGEKEITWNEWLSVANVTTKNSPLWKTNPKQQLGYLQVKNWARAYTPGAILGVYSADELEDLPRPPAEKNMGDADIVGSSTQSRADTVRDKLDGKPNAKAPTLDQVLASIKAASTTDDMEVAAAAAAKIIDTKDKEIARKAWGDRIKALKAATAAAAAPEPGNAGPAKTFAEVAEAINKAASMDELNLAMDLIRAVVDQEQQNELRDAAIQRKDQLSPI